MSAGSVASHHCRPSRLVAASRLRGNTKAATGQAFHSAEADEDLRGSGVACRWGWHRVDRPPSAGLGGPRTKLLYQVGQPRGREPTGAA